jgi:hypothetical protein
LTCQGGVRLEERALAFVEDPEPPMFTRLCGA